MKDEERRVLGGSDDIGIVVTNLYERTHIPTGFSNFPISYFFLSKLLF